jgi:archaemetzincin
MPDPYRELERKLRPLAEPLPAPRPGDWLAVRQEPGQTFADYLDARPIRKSEKLHTIYLCLIGEFNPAQRRILDLTRDYLALFFDGPVKVDRHVPLSAIPPRARRTHPTRGDPQVLTGYLLHELLEPERPVDALAYVALTGIDLWPGRGWNFVFGEANLRERTGVWSINRNGDPAQGDAAFRLCLRRTLGTASHELGHVLTMHHCTAFRCLMNGSNHQGERDGRPLHLCPVCLRKLCWNLRVEPVSYLSRLKTFCEQNVINPESGWYGGALATLAAGEADATSLFEKV